MEQISALEISAEEISAEEISAEQISIKQISQAQISRKVPIKLRDHLAGGRRGEHVEHESEV